MKSKKSKKIVFTLNDFFETNEIKLLKKELKKLKTNQIKSKNLFSILTLFLFILEYNI